jgi:two-component system cell cycle response regulator
MNVLVVDHSKVFRAVWDRNALRLGIEPITVSTAEEALEALRDQRIDLMCVSLSLPGMDGIDLVQVIRRLPPHRNLPVILLSATEDKGLRERAFAAGVTEIHDKKDIESLLQRVKRFVREHHRDVTGRVLYVEDSSVVAHVMMKILAEMQLEVDHFTSADEAIKSFEEHSYDLIISDILVEGQMSGVGLVSRIREASGDKARVPILTVSSLDDTARRIQLFKLGVNDFITKPVVKEEVIARVTNLITAKQLFDQVKQQQKHLYELAMIDPLTGLFNRNSLREFAHKYFLEATRHDFSLALLLIDVDHFKSINDTHGHLMGDTVLEELGAFLKRAIRDEDFAARYGGEEFLLILPHCNLEQACEKAQSLRAQIEDLHPGALLVTASIGVTARPMGAAVSMEELFRIADLAVYQAKEMGRNRVVCRKS